VDRDAVNHLACLLEEAGYQDADGLIEHVLIPIAMREQISLRTAMEIYANTSASSESWAYKLGKALNEIDPAVIYKLQINEPMGRGRD
jgi:hypothetical protein